MTLHLFEGYGLELEYMIVDRKTLAVKPICDQVLQKLAGHIVSEFEIDGVGISNELALHVLELKTAEPVPRIDEAVAPLHRVAAHLNAELAAFNACLLPGGMHPWMDPVREMVLWPHEYHEIYQTYHRIFNCAHHGWINLQSIHLNLPFCGDNEFGRLHAVIRYLLPLMPALAASSPIVGGTPAEARDARLIAYQENQRMVPSIAGQIVPDPVYSKTDYVTHVLEPMFRDMTQYDTEGMLRFEWLNSRGAIARFERDAIEIRVLDMQECPTADAAVTSGIVSVLRTLLEERCGDLKTLQLFPQERLHNIFRQCVREGELASIEDRDYLRGLGLAGTSAVTAGAIWMHLIDNSIIDAGFKTWWDVYGRHGCLASRLLKGLAPDTSQRGQEKLYRRLSHCLEQNQVFVP